jgi:lysylphosphatidylglycerol synthetase-like protein (DUF2156 family)
MRRGGEVLTIQRMIAAIFNLNHAAHTVHFHFNIGITSGEISLSVANVVAIVLMLVVFALAIALPFPQHRAGGGA